MFLKTKNNNYTLGPHNRCSNDRELEGIPSWEHPTKLTAHLAFCMLSPVVTTQQNVEECVPSSIGLGIQLLIPQKTLQGMCLHLSPHHNQHQQLHVSAHLIKTKMAVIRFEHPTRVESMGLLVE